MVRLLPNGFILIPVPWHFRLLCTKHRDTVWLVDGVALRLRLPAQRAPWRVANSRHTRDSDAPALRWASEFSQRENCHQPITTDVLDKQLTSSKTFILKVGHTLPHKLRSGAIKCEIRRWGAHPPRVWRNAPRVPLLRVSLTRTLGTFRCARRFPRRRGKQHPGRVRSPFSFGARLKCVSFALFA
jgi:hypothetical protein